MVSLVSALHSGTCEELDNSSTEAGSCQDVCLTPTTANSTKYNDYAEIPDEVSTANIDKCLDQIGQHLDENNNREPRGTLVLNSSDQHDEAVQSSDFQGNQIRIPQHVNPVHTQEGLPDQDSEQAILDRNNDQEPHGTRVLDSSGQYGESEATGHQVEQDSADFTDNNTLPSAYTQDFLRMGNAEFYMFSLY
ncbi:hypothetical protein K469DRAFT_132787 [Zopfia rhizophila CBS 207.26]|uniref:Uncharacterized protein n=1 Tax=Zopfia rhizophila CBS 207.26 TaxID=1314779 RepID=A0A6A6ERE0_9PEZI|nr:hypothetical protein K469DRAFT_132787 [Zopfia rhizophila CBS 207.26]